MTCGIHSRCGQELVKEVCDLCSLALGLRLWNCVWGNIEGVSKACEQSI